VYNLNVVLVSNVMHNRDVNQYPEIRYPDMEIPIPPSEIWDFVMIND